MISESQLHFYKENGYLIINDFLSSEKIDELSASYLKLREKLSEQAGISFEDYQKEISQVRDLWRFNEDYKKLILEDEIAKTAPLFFEDNSCRLLHDHIINKPKGNNGTVPWHQDYTYWPVDCANGLSFWLPFSDLDANAGVLEVIPKSHLWGEELPVDFMNDAKDFSNQEVTFLEVKKGDLVVLDALAWHRTSENTSIEERMAYISLWIPSDAKYAPKHASWHPVNDNITVNENEVLNNDWFPAIGNYNFESATTSVNKAYLDNSFTEKQEKITMFNASKITRKFLQKHLDYEGDIWKHLYIKQNRAAAIQKLSQLFELSQSQIEELESILHAMAINSLAYQDHRARNVYNQSYLNFKSIFRNEIQ
ncbi:phytanoyl-CoA dioxygenase family protein [Flavobacterium sp.]|uniref:phytanoyl-CoA dioxygenase family protein n=3 Tax=Flavobacterium sp. TaxID=239 RepID=UPI0040480DF2